MRVFATFFVLLAASSEFGWAANLTTRELQREYRQQFEAMGEEVRALQATLDRLQGDLGSIRSQMGDFRTTNRDAQIFLTKASDISERLTKLEERINNTESNSLTAKQVTTWGSIMITIFIAALGVMFSQRFIDLSARAAVSEALLKELKDDLARETKT